MTPSPGIEPKGILACFRTTLLVVCAAPVACLGGTGGTTESHAKPERVVAKMIDQSISDRDEVGFSYLVVSNSGPVFEFQGGKVDAALSTLVDSKTMFLSASTTKIITAIAVLRLVDQGKLDLDDPLSDYFNTHPYGEAVTTRMLLNHTAGIPNPLPLKWIHTEAEHRKFSESRAREQALADSPRLESDPGAEYRYSNLGYWLLGSLIERVSKQDFTAFVRTEILSPLGIVEEELTFEAPREEHWARGHYKRFSLLGLALPLISEERIRARPVGTWGRFERVHMNGLAYGGAFATARGYGKLLTDLLREHSEILSDDARRELFRAQSDGKGRSWGVTVAFRQGQLDGMRFFSKPGGGPGVSSNIRIYPDLGIATVFLSNRMRVSESEIQGISDAIDRPFLGTLFPVQG
jgi:D-alanyl-D-alanine carboxypeptidase